MTAAEIDAFYAAHLKGISRSTNGQRYARCPFHDDRKASFSYNIEKDGVWSCHGGCGSGGLYDFSKRMNLPGLPRLNGKSYFPEPSAIYDYRDEDGVLLYQALRYTPKAFKQRRPDGRGGWIWNLQGVRRVLYRLPELIKAKAQKSRVFIVEGEALATQTPADLAAMLFLAVVACACQKKVAVLVRYGWVEPVNVFLVIVMPPGSRKTRAFSALEEPIRKFEEDMAKEMAPKITSAETRYRILQGRVQKANAKAAGAEGPEAEALTKEAEALSYEAAMTLIPVIPRLVADDVTPERLATMLKEQDGRMSVMSAEGGIFDLMSGRYSKDGSANFEVLLKGHAGDTLRVDRVGRPAEYVSHPALTMGLAVQPEVIGGLVRKPGFRGRGLLGRFLYSLPRNLLGRRKIGAPPLSDDIRDLFKKKIRDLLAIPLDLDERSKPKTRLLKLSPEAVKRMLEFEAWVEPQMAEFGALGSMTDWGGKLVGGVARIAGLLHMAEHADREAPWDIRISRETVERAIRIGEYLIPHARAAYTAMGAEPAVEDAKHVLAWIRRQGIADFTKRGLFQSLKGCFKRVSQMEPVLALLQEHVFIRRRSEETRSGAGRKPSPVYEVNPLWLGQSGNSEDCGNSEERVEASPSSAKVDSEDGDRASQANLSETSPMGSDGYPSSWNIEVNQEELRIWEPGSDFQEAPGFPTHAPQEANVAPQYPHNPQNGENQGGYCWPEESLDAERRFGHACAKFYPFLNKRVLTRQGAGILWQVAEDRLGVALDVNPNQVCFMPPDEVRPAANGGPIS